MPSVKTRNTIYDNMAYKMVIIVEYTIQLTKLLYGLMPIYGLKQAVISKGKNTQQKFLKYPIQ
jgi:hypothetical protein